MPDAPIPATRLAPNEGVPLQLTWRHPQGLFALSAANFFLRIITLGIYNFWGKTEVRKRIWSAVRIDGEPLHYTGTGLELFLGFLIVFFVIVIPVLLISAGAVFVLGPESPAFDLFQIALYAAFFFLTGIAFYRAQRYRLSRTRWRGIRGSLTGSDRSYAWTYFWTGLLIPLSAGWIVPWRSTKLQALMTRDTAFGNRRFEFFAASGPLYLRYTLLWIGAVLIVAAAGIAIGGVIGAEIATFEAAGSGSEFKPSPTAVAVSFAIAAVAYILYAVFSAWYRAHQTRHFAAHTHFEGASFKSRVTAGGLIWIGVTNILIVVLSLGLLIPIAQARAARYFVENLEIGGAVQLENIAQGEDQGIARGEGLAQAFDIDAF